MTSQLLHLETACTKMLMTSSGVLGLKRALGHLLGLSKQSINLWFMNSAAQSWRFNKL